MVRTSRIFKHREANEKAKKRDYSGTSEVAKKWAKKGMKESLQDCRIQPSKSKSCKTKIKEKKIKKLRPSHQKLSFKIEKAEKLKKKLRISAGV